MNGRDDLIGLIKSMSGQANILTIPRLFVNFVRSHRAALFLSQCVYWSDRSTMGDGWFWKSYREWRDELGLNQHAVETCVAALEAGGWLETKIARIAGRDTKCYRARMEAIAATIRITLAETANVTLAETANVTLAETARVPKRKTLTSHIRDYKHRPSNKAHGSDREQIIQEFLDGKKK